MEQKTKFFYLPFVALLVYTFGAIFLLTIPTGVYLSPGGTVLSATTGEIFSASLLLIVIVMLFLSVRKKRKNKYEK